MNDGAPAITKTVVTSFSPKGYEEYGRNFILSFMDHWPATVRLVVYYEPAQVFDVTDKAMEAGGDQVQWRPIGEVEGLDAYLAAVQYFPVFCGQVNGQYNIQQDARMARKAFIEAHACKTFGGKVFWIDSDVITHSDVPESFLDDMLPDDKFCCFLGREKMYTESGFLGFNAGRDICQGFFDNYLGVFKSGAFVTLNAWHDCVAFDAVRRAIEQFMPGQFVNLGFEIDPGPGHHVFINAVLGKYMDHLKGPRKGLGKSPQNDLTIARPESYWHS